MRHAHPLVARLLLAFIALAVLSGCNTMRGVGKDLERAGESIQRKAEKHD
jgi:predicted small secreted protein